MNILIGPLRFVPFAADIPVSLLAAIHFEQRVERLEVGGEIGDVVLQEQGVLLGKATFNRASMSLLRARALATSGDMSLSWAKRRCVSTMPWVAAR